MELLFDDSRYTVETVCYDNATLTYRAFEHICYVENPADKQAQCLSIFVPECFYQGQTVNGYSLKTAHIFFANSVGGYRPGPERSPKDVVNGKIPTSFYALLHGYVVISPGTRGRGMQSTDGKWIGCAPAVICDLKAAVRYLRYNKERIPGDTDKIISNGTSAGGASSSLLGSTGNHPDYENFLIQMGAAKESDTIFAASCYCPITNLDHADMAYEWEFDGIYEYKKNKPDTQELPVMTDAQIALSKKLSALFPDYVNSLVLTDERGTDLTLDADGNGSFKEYIKKLVIQTAQNELKKGTDLSAVDWITIAENQVQDIDFGKYVHYRMRMKTTPAFDNVALGTAENELFGTADCFERHFTQFSFKHSTANGSLADNLQVKMMNPMYYIADSKAEKAKHFRIRHGAIDRDTSLAIPTILATSLRMQGIDTSIAFPWGIPHAGDYDLEELFAWIDEICR